MNREFVMLAKEYKAQLIAGWFASVKMDGQRAFWDGGISRGMNASDVPFANTAKDGRLTVAPVATGLWSRYGKVIRAPDWFLDQLPVNLMLDGELYCGRNSFQKCRSIVADHNAGEGWKEVHYNIFDVPSWQEFSRKEQIRNPNFEKYMDFASFPQKLRIQTPVAFADVVEFLKRNIVEYSNMRVHHQVQLPWGSDTANAKLNEMLDIETSMGGEGIMLRKPESIWTPVRSNDLLKVKRMQDSEAAVIGYTSGQGKLLGMMGALIVSWNDKVFQLSGFTDDERTLLTQPITPHVDDNIRDWARANPEKEIPSWGYAQHFPRGTMVTFRYRELTDAGIPKEARFWRRA